MRRRRASPSCAARRGADPRRHRRPGCGAPVAGAAARRVSAAGADPASAWMAAATTASCSRWQRATALPVHLAEAGDVAGSRARSTSCRRQLGVDRARRRPALRRRTCDAAGQRCRPPTARCSLLSGSDPADVDAAHGPGVRAARWSPGRSPEGCYDAAARRALIARGGDAGCARPTLVKQLAAALARLRPLKSMSDDTTTTNRHPRRPDPGRRRRLLLPNATIAEVMSFADPEPVAERAGLAARPHPLARLAVAADRVRAPGRHRRGTRRPRQQGDGAQGARRRCRSRRTSRC